MTAPEEILNRVAQIELGFGYYEVDQTAEIPVPTPETWLGVGLRRNIMTDEVEYCDEQLVQEVFALRSSLDNHDERAIRAARGKTNFFEVRHGQFMTRAAVKLANLDACYGWLLCRLPEDQRNELMYFVDVFGGPGGCAEYIMWRNGGWMAKGFGFTTRGDYEFQPEMFKASPSETLDAFYGKNDDGNLFDPQNIRQFQEYVLAHTDKLGVHLLVCDGGFFIKNNNQEVISKQLYLCLALLAVSVVRPGGSAAIKVFDLYTPFSVGLVYMLSRCYARISIVKPSSSRPANSERYVVCQDRLDKQNYFKDYLITIVQVLWEHKHSSSDVLRLVSSELIKSDADFYNFIRASNNELAQRQIAALKDLIAALDARVHPEPRDPRLMKETLWQAWKLDQNPPLARSSDYGTKSANDYALQFLPKNTLDLFRCSDTPLTEGNSLRKLFGDPNHWSFVPLDVTSDFGKTIRTMFLSKGNGNVFYYDRQEATWFQVKDFQLILSPQTILYGEIVEEIKEMKDGQQRKTLALHIIDAILLGGQDIRGQPLARRNALCTKFARALNRPLAERNTTTVQPIPVRAKQLFALPDLDSFFNGVSINPLTSGIKVMGCDLKRYDGNETKRFYIPRGLIFLRHSEGRAVMDFDRTFAGRLLWTWTKTAQVYSRQCFNVEKEPALVYRVDFEELIEEMMMM